MIKGYDLGEIGEAIVCLPNKYTIISTYLMDSMEARNFQFGYLQIIVDSRMQYVVAH